MSSDLLLLLAGVAAGIIGTVAGLASLVSYPALLAFGLPPLAANVTNTTAMTSVMVGAAAGARAELRGLRRRLLLLSVCCATGGALGAGLLLWLPASTFAAVVPWLVATGSVLRSCGTGHACGPSVCGPAGTRHVATGGGPGPWPWRRPVSTPATSAPLRASSCSRSCRCGTPRRSR